MTKSSSDLLDQAMEHRRLELGMSWKEVAAAAGVSVETLTALRKGRVNAANANPLTKRGVERALKWEPGGFDEALAGRAPRSTGGRAAGAGADAPLVAGAYGRDQARRIIDTALELLPPEKQLELLQQMSKDLEAQQQEEDQGRSAKEQRSDRAS